MESVDYHDDHLNPPEQEHIAECEICGERHECSDMVRVDPWDDKWVCDLLKTACLDEYMAKHPIENEGD